MNNCLILIDLQNDYFPGGNMELKEINKAAVNAQLLLKKFRTANLPVVHIQHFSVRPGSTFFLPETAGVEINELVAPLKDEKVVTKNYPNSFRETGLLEIIEKIKCKRLVICGAMSHMCIDATTRAAFDYGFSIDVAEDACATKDLTFKGETIRAAEVHASFMAALSVPYADVLTTDGIIEKIA
jgi:nicotinamidase-related amidase